MRCSACLCRRYRPILEIQADGLGVEIERGSDANHGSRIDLSEVFGHPLFLLWRPEPDSDNVGMSVVDSLHDAAVFFCRERSKGRRVCAADGKAGKRL
jgi:hypothetical protein